MWAKMPNDDYTCVSCETEYGAARPFWDPNARECVSGCPDTFSAGTSKTCLTCE